MSTFTEGQIIKRRDGAVFPDDKHWAAVTTKAGSLFGSRFDQVWLLGGQWVPEHEVIAVTPDEVLGVVERYAVLTQRPDLVERLVPKLAEKPAEPLSEAQWRSAVNRHKKRAAKANEHNQELVAENLKLKKEAAEAKVQARRNIFDGDSAEANHSALLLIREIVKEVQPVVRLV